MKLRHCLVCCSALWICSCTRQHVASTRVPQTAVQQTAIRQVINAADLGDGDVQSRTLRDELLSNPNNLTARLALANRYWTAGVTELAVDHYRIAADRSPENAQVAMLLARCLRDCNRSTESIEILEKYRLRNPNTPVDLLSLLGILHDDSGQFSEAERIYRSALLLDPERADLHNNLGYNLMLQGRSSQAVAQFQRALAINPHSEFANNNLGLALLSQWKDDSQPAEAILRWQSVSDPATAHNNLATVLLEQKRYAEARKELEIALGYRRDHPAALHNLQVAAEADGGTSVPVQAARNSFWKRAKTVFTKRKAAASETAALKQ